MRDLFKDGFTAEDFKTAFNTSGDALELSEKANAILRAALAEAQTVYGQHDRSYEWAIGFRDMDTHKARLVAIERIDEESEVAGG